MEDFVDFLGHRDREISEKALRRAAMTASEASFAAVGNDQRTTFTMPSEADDVGFGDVVLVPFSFTDQSGTKRRPAVVIGTARDALRHALNQLIG
ncbi:hypothetical protein [Sphingomonas sp.]|jgi:hypothetical protein|uniref:hypothetical protein n=1 Tax=Sphingomonas sp. TaxID=28214 RepID=UPI002ED93005